MSRTFLSRQKSGYLGVNALLGTLLPHAAAAAPTNAVVATLTVDPAGANNSMTYTAKRKGAYGNGIHVAYATPLTPSAALSVGVVGKVITVNLATGPGTVQVETATVTAAAGATSNGNLAVTVTSALLVSPAAVQVALDTTMDTATKVAAAIAAALTADPVLGALWTFVGNAATIVMTRKAAQAAANDVTENLAIAAGLGVTAAANSANSTPGVASAATSTAAQVKTAIEASAAAAALVTVANAGGDNGTGACAAVADAPMTSGVDGTDGEPWECVVYGGWVYINVSDDAANTGAVDTWYKHQLTLVT
jgi:hypothetical protein